jgi:hypothetical protein
MYLEMHKPAYWHTHRYTWILRWHIVHPRQAQWITE